MPPEWSARGSLFPLFMALQYHRIVATALVVVVSLIAVCCSGESDTSTSTQLLFIKLYY